MFYFKSINTMNIYQFKRKIGLLISLPFSIYFNFHYLPLKQAIKLPIILYYPRFWGLGGKVVIKSSNVRFGMIRLGLFNASIDNGNGFTWMNEGGTVVFYGDFAAGPGSVFKIAKNALLEFGHKVNNTSSLKIDSHCHIKIKDWADFGWNVIIMDSNLHRLKNSDGSWAGKGYEPIEIGNNSWISSHCVILPGTHFPAYSVSSFGSILNKDYSNCGNGLYAGRPAKLIKEGIWRDMSDCQIEYDFINQ